MGYSTSNKDAGARFGMKILIIILSIILSACSQIHAPQIVNVPVAEKLTAPSIPMKPYLPIEDLTVKSTAADVMKGYVASVSICDGYSDSLLKILQGYQ